MEEEAEQFDLPFPNLATEDTYGDGGEDDVCGRWRTASVRSQQLSASSPASSRASGGARVRARVEEYIMTVVRRVFIGTGAAQCYYTGAPGDSHLKDMWPSCNMSEVVPRSHTRLDCRVVVPLLRVSGEGISIESGLNVCLCIFC